MNNHFFSPLTLIFLFLKYQEYNITKNFIVKDYLLYFLLIRTSRIDNTYEYIGRCQNKQA